MKAVLPAIARALVEPQLPADLDVTWVASVDEAVAAAVDADIAWVDLPPHGLTEPAVAAATRLRWLFTAVAGLDSLDLGALRRSGAVVTNGAGINAVAVAEYAVMGVLAAAKRYDRVVRMADAREWPDRAPGTTELDGTAALVIGMGSIGRAVADRLAPFGVSVTGVTRSGANNTLRAHQWREGLGAFDWVILTAPSTPDTRAMIGAAELAAMKRTAWLVNVARGDMIDDDALVTALRDGQIGGAFLDPTNPEPLPRDHPLWSAPDCLITMHLSGRSQRSMFPRAARRFLANLDRFRAGQPLEYVVDLTLGY